MSRTMKSLICAALLCPSLLFAENLFQNGDMEKSIGWKGDKSYTKLGDVTVLELKASPRKIVSFFQDAKTRDLKDVEVAFKYMTKDYKGRGLQLRGERPGGGGTFRNETLVTDGAWHEVKWRFSEIRDNRSILFHFNLLEGEGTVYFDDVTLTPL